MGGAGELGCCGLTHSELEERRIRGEREGEREEEGERGQRQTLIQGYLASLAYKIVRVFISRT